MHASSTRQANRFGKSGKEELVDHSAVGDGSLYTDNRVLIADLSHDEYPYTVSFSYTQPLRDNVLPPV